MSEWWDAELAAELEEMQATTARLNRLARARVMSSSPGREQCVYCGEVAYEPGWGCHVCGTAEL